MPKADRFSSTSEEISVQRDNDALFKVDELVKDHLMEELELLTLAARGLCEMSSHSQIEPRHVGLLLRQIARALHIASDVSGRLGEIREQGSKVAA